MRARIPGRTCLASTTSKGGNSKSFNKGLASRPSSTTALAAIEGAESEEKQGEKENEGETERGVDLE